MVCLFAQHGWEQLEISECHAHDLLAQGQPASAGRAFRAYAADHGLSFAQGHLPVVWYAAADRSQGETGYFDIAPLDDEEQIRAMGAIQQWFELFAVLGIRYAVLHMGGSTLKEAGWPDRAVFDRRTRSLSEAARYAAQVGITVCLENLCYPNCGVETLEEIVALIRGADADNLAICLDTGHAVMAGQDCEEFLLEGGDLIRALHLHDNIGTSDYHVLPYEQETIPWDRILGSLGKIGYDGVLNFEIPGRSWRPMPVREARLDYARVLAEYMVGHVACSNAGSSRSVS
jgi:sugar phosphate isomerase/epimerase